MTSTLFTAEQLAERQHPGQTEHQRYDQLYHARHDTPSRRAARARSDARWYANATNRERKVAYVRRWRDAHPGLFRRYELRAWRNERLAAREGFALRYEAIGREIELLTKELSA